eukprot:3433220-Pleurochrysis_carterae.AAC.2
MGNWNAPQDTVGIVLAGTEATENELAVECGGYAHVSVASQMAPVSFRAVQSLSTLACGPSNADIIDALVVAAHELLRYVRKLKFSKRLMLVTDGSCSAAIDEEQATDLPDSSGSEKQQSKL